MTIINIRHASYKDVSFLKVNIISKIIDKHPQLLLSSTYWERRIIEGAGNQKLL